MQTIGVNKDKNESFQSTEAYKNLRSNIEFSGEDIKVVCVTSALPNDGKSTTSLKLAQAFAQTGKSTLLIDADLRKSVMLKSSVKHAVPYGLAHLLIGKVSFEDAICKTNLENFYILFAGSFPPNPSELLGGERFRAMIEEARQYFDCVIIDTPPIGSVIDAAVVSKCCDGVILIVRSGRVSYRFAQRVKNQLDTAGAKLLGCVLNGVDFTGRGYYKNYYKGYYKNYYRTEKNSKER